MSGNYEQALSVGPDPDCPKPKYRPRHNARPHDIWRAPPDQNPLSGAVSKGASAPLLLCSTVLEARYKESRAAALDLILLLPARLSDYVRLNPAQRLVCPTVTSSDIQLTSNSATPVSLVGSFESMPRTVYLASAGITSASSSIVHLPGLRKRVCDAPGKRSGRP